MFSKRVRIRDSNKAEVLAILEVLGIFSRSFHMKLIVESDSFNAVSWVTKDDCKPWKLHFYFNKIKDLVCCIQVVFHHHIQFANGLADSLEKQGVVRSVS